MIWVKLYILFSGSCQSYFDLGVNTSRTPNNMIKMSRQTAGTPIGRTDIHNGIMPANAKHSSVMVDVKIAVISGIRFPLVLQAQLPANA